MTMVCEVEAGCMFLSIETCPDVEPTSTTDHFHFTIRVRTSGIYKEDITGVVYGSEGELVTDLVTRVIEIYSAETLKTLKQEIKRGLETLQ
jgi:hypothetical protein